MIDVADDSDAGRQTAACIAVAQLVENARTTYAAARTAVGAMMACETLLTIAANAQAPELATEQEDIAALRALVKGEADRRMEEAADAVGRLILGR